MIVRKGGATTPSDYWGGHQIYRGKSKYASGARGTTRPEYPPYHLHIYRRHNAVSERHPDSEGINTRINEVTAGIA